MSEREYTRDDVIYQSLVAFGQGTNYTRVSTRACREIARIAGSLAEERELATSWGTIAVQLLERVRVAGRIAAARAVEAGSSYIDFDDVRVATRKARLGSKSTSCGGDDGNDGDDGSGGTSGSDAQPADVP